VAARPTAPSSASCPPTLWERITQRYDAAQASRASLFTETDTELVEERVEGRRISYIVKIARRLRDKPKNVMGPRPSREDKMKNNPFLPPDPNLYVCRLTPTHSLVLNKFNITPHHVIVITDAFEEQEVPLSEADFEATWQVVEGMGGPGSSGGMAFFNCGPLSGASQPHKHIQCIPLPIAGRVASGEAESSSSPPPPSPSSSSPPPPSSSSPPPPSSSSSSSSSSPFEAVILEEIEGKGAHVQEATTLPFVHGVAALGVEGMTTAAGLHATYGKLLEALEARLRGRWTRGDSYNVLLTKKYMMVVPRRAEYVESVGANAMGFAGSFFLGTQEEIDDLKRLGPGTVLRALGFDA
jgi:ATP adenylyltransferase